MKIAYCSFVLLLILALSCNGDSLPSQNKPGAQAGGQVQVDTSKAKPIYANFSRVTGTPEEVIIDFGLNGEPFGVPKDPIIVDPRIVMNFYTAKRFAAALQLTIQRHEEAFGPIETDVQKRVGGGR